MCTTPLVHFTTKIKQVHVIYSTSDLLQTAAGN